MAVLKKLATDLDAAVRKGLPTAGALKQDLMALAGVLGVLQADPQAWFQGGADEDLRARIDGLVAARDAARAAKDWPEADRIRARAHRVERGGHGRTRRRHLADQGAGLMPIAPPPQLKAGLFARGSGTLQAAEGDRHRRAAAQGAQGRSHRAPHRHPGAGRGDLGADLRPDVLGDWNPIYPRPPATSASARRWR